MLRAWAGGEPPPSPLVLVDWADEEGARFGRSLFGSSAFAGTLEPAEVAGLRDPDGRALADVLAENGVELAQVPHALRAASGLGAYLELHIEQGPVMEAEGLRAAAVTGCVGVERLRLDVPRAGSARRHHPDGARRDAMLAAADVALAIERIGRGRRRRGDHRRPAPASRGSRPRSPARAALSVDLRHPEAEPLARMLEAAPGGGRRGRRPTRLRGRRAP